MVERDAFCLHLKQARERSGLTLHAISDTTKIQASLLAGLECGDVARWPGGIFRRAFVREYATAIGLPPDRVVSEFCRLFPEDGAAPVSAGASTPQPALQDDADGLRMTLAPDWRWWIAPSRARGAAAALDVLIVVLAGLAVGQFVPWNPWIPIGASALLYYPLVTLCSGATVGSLLLASRPDLRWRSLGRRAEKPRAVHRPRLVFRRSAPAQNAEADGSARQELRAAN